MLAVVDRPAEKTGVNAELLREVVAAIDANPRLWDPHTFLSRRATGQAGCLASWTCRVAGLNVRLLLWGDVSGSAVHFAGRDLLGLTELQASRLFSYRDGPDGQPVSWPAFRARIERVTGVSL